MAHIKAYGAGILGGIGQIIGGLTLVGFVDLYSGAPLCATGFGTLVGANIRPRTYGFFEMGELLLETYDGNLQRQKFCEEVNNRSSTKNYAQNSCRKIIIALNDLDHDDRICTWGHFWRRTSVIDSVSEYLAHPGDLLLGHADFRFRSILYSDQFSEARRVYLSDLADRMFWESEEFESEELGFNNPPPSRQNTIVPLPMDQLIASTQAKQDPTTGMTVHIEVYSNLDVNKLIEKFGIRENAEPIWIKMANGLLEEKTAVPSEKQDGPTVQKSAVCLNCLLGVDDPLFESARLSRFGTCQCVSATTVCQTCLPEVSKNRSGFNQCPSCRKVNTDLQPAFELRVVTKKSSVDSK